MRLFAVLLILIHSLKSQNIKAFYFLTLKELMIANDLLF